MPLPTVCHFYSCVCATPPFVVVALTRMHSHITLYLKISKCCRLCDSLLPLSIHEDKRNPSSHYTVCDLPLVSKHYCISHCLLVLLPVCHPLHYLSRNTAKLPALRA